jgi:hypothetical protein
MMLINLRPDVEEFETFLSGEKKVWKVGRKKLEGPKRSNL